MLLAKEAAMKSFIKKMDEASDFWWMFAASAQ